jgi:hypothetical protein
MRPVPGVAAGSRLSSRAQATVTIADLHEWCNDLNAKMLRDSDAEASSAPDGSAALSPVAGPAIAPAILTRGRLLFVRTGSVDGVVAGRCLINGEVGAGATGILLFG